MLYQWAGLAIGGIVGTIARYVLSGTFQGLFGFKFPAGTLCVNLLGCLISGFFFTFADIKGLLNSDARLFIQIGFCGAFTTFSSFMLETVSLLRDGEMFLGLVNIGASLIGCLIVFIMGAYLAHQI